MKDPKAYKDCCRVKTFRETFLKKLQVRVKHMSKYGSTFFVELTGESKVRLIQFSGSLKPFNVIFKFFNNTQIPLDTPYRKSIDTTHLKIPQKGIQ